jgi:ABC-type dipeptide/oligopeptide/nickel transport system ATPase subunit
MKNTLIINLFGASGSGKSTTAYGLAYHLKKMGRSAEYINEYAKNKSWLKDFKTLKQQPYVFEKQVYYQTLPLNQVDFIINDSPIILADFYGQIYSNPRCIPEWRTYAWATFNGQNNVSFFLERNSEIPFEEVGRNQTSEESMEHEEIMRKWLEDNSHLPVYLKSSKDTVKDILDYLTVHKYLE